MSQLLEAPQQFGFFQAVRLLEQWVGLEAVQFHNSVSMSFAPSEVESVRAQWTSPEAVGLPGPGRSPALDDAACVGPKDAQRLERIDLTPACMGLLGVSGALPLFYTELLSQAEVKGGPSAARAFLDVFSHRSVTLFYQAWCKHRLGVRHEQEAVRHRASQQAEAAASAPRAFVSEVLALSGIGLKGMRHRLGAARGGVSDEALAYFSGTLQQRTLPMAQLQRLLTHYLGVPVAIDPFVGRWYLLPQASRTVLGGSEGEVCAGVLGRSAMLGERVWQRNLCVRLVIGPLDRTPFLRFLPGGAGARALRQWLQLLVGPALEVEVQLRLRRDAVQGCALRSDRSPLVGRLGWDTFLLSGTPCTDRDDVQYDICPGAPEPMSAACASVGTRAPIHTPFNADPAWV
jgi:type VI secretion system protein ImpH